MLIVKSIVYFKVGNKSKEVCVDSGCQVVKQILWCYMTFIISKVDE